MDMYKISILLACSACIGQGRRWQSLALRLNDFPFLGKQAIRHVASGGRLNHRLPVVSMSVSDGPDPEDWRAFRAKLISGGLQLSTDDDANNASEEAKLQRTSVAPANEALLKQQNEALWKEYLEGAWAHETPFPEVGGLLCRLPLPAQLTEQLRATPDQDALIEQFDEVLRSELPSDEGGDNTTSTRLLKTWLSNTAYMYRLAERFIQDSMQSLVGRADSSGRVLFSSLPADLQQLVRLNAKAADEWQEVVLVLSVDENQRTAQGLVMNRPLALGNIKREFAKLLLNGAPDASTGTPVYDDKFLDKFMRAFGAEVAVYRGGGELQEMGGILVHGIPLPGATELAPGTRIFRGGVEAAVEAVLSGEHSPLDFRWFIGRKIDLTTRGKAYGAVACARPIALKQCIGLPKPLWHEVLELCGGDLAEISRIELLKRDDLEEADEEGS